MFPKLVRVVNGFGPICLKCYVTVICSKTKTKRQYPRNNMCSGLLYWVVSKGYPPSNSSNSRMNRTTTNIFAEFFENTLGMSLHFRYKHSRQKEEKSVRGIKSFVFIKGCPLFRNSQKYSVFSRYTSRIMAGVLTKDTDSKDTLHTGRKGFMHHVMSHNITTITLLKFIAQVK